MTTATHQAPAYRTAPAIGYALIKDGNTHTPTNTVIYHGLQPDGRYLDMGDLDSHGNGQDADAARMALARQLPEIHAKIDWHRSRSGTGWHGYFYTNGPMPHGKLYDQDGRHIGEMIANDTAVSIPPEGLAPGWLSATERDLLLRFWTVDAPADNGERWTDRAAEGLKYIAGAYKYHYSEADLVRYLRIHCNRLDPKTGAVIRRVGAEYLNGDTLNSNVRNRSDQAGRLMQTIALYIRRAYPAAGFVECIQRSYALWLAAKSFGKAYDKDYNQEKDGASLIAQIIHGDAYGPKDAYRWTVPFWAKAHPTPAPAAAAPEPTPAPTKPAHRPAGDRDKMRRKIRRYLELRAFETVGKLYYSASDLADVFGIARRTMQGYLAEIPELTRGQDGGRGGRAWLVWCADNSQKAAEPAAESAAFWCADAIAVQGLQTPQTDDRTPQCKVDHQDLCAPPPPAVDGASYDPHRDCIAGPARWADSRWHDPSAPRVRPDAPLLPPEPRRRRQQQPKGQTRFTGRDRQQVSARYARRKSHGQPPEPTPYRPPARMEEATLPEPPGALGAPAGAHGSGDLPQAPAGAAPEAGDLYAPGYVSGMIERLWQRQAGAA